MGSEWVLKAGEVHRSREMEREATIQVTWDNLLPPEMQSRLYGERWFHEDIDFICVIYYYILNFLKVKILFFPVIFQAPKSKHKVDAQKYYLKKMNPKISKIPNFFMGKSNVEDIL